MFEAATTILVGAAISWITVQLSVNKFRSERWWERKVDAYERVIEALHHIKAVETVELHYAEQMRDVPEERDRELAERVKPAYEEMRKVFDVGAFQLSAKAYARIMEFNEEREAAWEANLGYATVDLSLHAAETCLKDFIVIAREDLGQKERTTKLWDMR